MKHMIRKSQLRFTRGKLSSANLITFYDKVTCSADVGQVMDVVYLNFSKTFNKVFHSPLLEQLMCYGLDKWSMHWMGNSQQAAPTGWW